MTDDERLRMSHLFMVVSDLERARKSCADEVGLELLLPTGPSFACSVPMVIEPRPPAQVRT